jgi:hypothetical protein
MQPPRPTECHCPRWAATEARTLSVLRRPIGAVKGARQRSPKPSDSVVADALPYELG